MIRRVLDGPRVEPSEPLRPALVDLAAHLSSELQRRHIEHALIGGMAVAVLKVPRATEDLDLLIPIEREADVHALMVSEGYEVLQRTENVSNYLRGSARVDFLHAVRAYARAMLVNARDLDVGRLRLRVVQPEDLIGLKVQATSNDPKRWRDLDDIQRLLRAHAGSLDMDRVREYFRIFDREAELDAILQDLPGSPR